MHLHGKAGIQNSVLSLANSIRAVILVTRVCSTSGKLMTVKTCCSSVCTSRSVALPLRVSFEKKPLPALPTSPAAFVPVCLMLCNSFPLSFRTAGGGTSSSCDPIVLSADLLRMEEPIMSR